MYLKLDTQLEIRSIFSCILMQCHYLHSHAKPFSHGEKSLPDQPYPSIELDRKKFMSCKCICSKGGHVSALSRCWLLIKGKVPPTKVLTLRLYSSSYSSKGAQSGCKLKFLLDSAGSLILLLVDSSRTWSMQVVKNLIRLHGCVGWSEPLLLA